MKAIHAIFQDGVFRPTTPVDLPEGSEVTIEPKQIVEAEDTEAFLLADDGPPRPSDPMFAHLSPEVARVHAILSRRYDGGSPDGSAQHDEHQQ